MTNRRVISLIYNLTRGLLVDSTNSSLSTAAYPIIMKGEFPCLFLDVVTGEAGTSYAAYTGLTADMTWVMYISQTFDKGTTDSPVLPMMSILNADFNVVGDRTDLSVVTGKLSVRMRADAITFGSVLNPAGADALELLQCMAEIRAYKSILVDSVIQSVPVLFIQFPIICKNDLSSGATETSLTSSYYTKTEMDARLDTRRAVFISLDEVWAYK